MRFRFKLDERDVVGVVQGNGGVISRAEQLEGAQRMAAEGRPHGLYEPEPGCVVVFPDYSAAGYGPRLHVPIATYVGSASLEKGVSGG